MRPHPIYLLHPPACFTCFAYAKQFLNEISNIHAGKFYQQLLTILVKVPRLSKTVPTKMFWLQSRGGARHFHLGGPLEGPVLQQGELSMICVGLSERDLLQRHDVTRKILGGQAKFWVGSGTP